MERNFKAPLYLLRIMDTENGSKTRVLSAGVAQGFMPGPDIWNVTYDGILRMEIPEGSFLVGYADDIAAVIVARDVERAQMRLNHGLELALAKAEIMLLTKKRIPLIREMRVEDTTVQTKPAVKNLGVNLDCRLTFGYEIHKRAEKATEVVAALSRLKANVGGPRPCKGRLLLHTTDSIVLYGSEIWADALRCEKYRKCIAAVQRRATLRIASSYVPHGLGAAGVIPIDLQARERQSVH